MESRKRRSAEQWQALIDEQQTSKLSVKAFCRERNLSAASFYQWRQRVCVAPSTPNPSSVPFLDVSALAKADATSRWQIELELGDGLVLRLGRH